jgi:hypothetical protein
MAAPSCLDGKFTSDGVAKKISFKELQVGIHMGISNPWLQVLSKSADGCWEV